MKLSIPSFSRYYLNTDDNRVYNKHMHPMAEYVYEDDLVSTPHPVVRITLTDDSGKIRNLKKHRLVYMAFNPEQDISGLDVNHLDEDPLNNDITNLVACTHKENMNWGTCRSRISESKTGKRINNGCPVKATVIDTGEVEYYNTIKDACIALGANKGHICECCRGTRNHTSGRTWEYYWD